MLSGSGRLGAVEPSNVCRTCQFYFSRHYVRSDDFKGLELQSFYNVRLDLNTENFLSKIPTRIFFSTTDHDVIIASIHISMEMQRILYSKDTAFNHFRLVSTQNLLSSF